MKVIFLDIDGVLKTENYIRWELRKPKHKRRSRALWCPIACSNLNAIADVSEGEVGICLSSSWRLGRTAAEIRDLLMINNIKLPFYGVTPFNGFDPNNSKAARGKEIQQWHGSRADIVDAYVIIDDDDDMLPYQQDFFVHCDSKTGLTEMEKVRQTIKILNT